MPVITMKYTDTVSAETITVGPDAFGRMDDAGVDVFLFGRSFGLAYGDLVEANISGETVSSITIEAQRLSDGSPVGDPVTMATSIDHGTMDLHHWAPGAFVANPLYDKWVTWYLGKNSGEVPEAVYNTQRDLGPDPDPENTESTGSGRLWAFRCAHTYAALINNSGQDGAEADRWVEEQADRACYYYYSDNGYAPYQADPSHYIGTGYSSSGGGFSTLFSAVLPPGVDFTGPGRTVPHATHLTLDGLICAAYLYADGMAARMAIHTVQAVATSLYNNEKWSARAFGRFFKTLAELAPLISFEFPGTGNMVTIAVRAITALKAKNRNGAPAPDNGSTAEGGHLDKNEVTAVLAPLGFSAAQIQNYARSDNSWFVCQLFTGLLAVRKLWPTYGLSAGQGLGNLGAEDALGPGQSYFGLLTEQLDLAGTWILKCSQMHIDIHGTVMQGPKIPTHGFWDDVSAGFSTQLRIAEGGDADNFAYGVGARFMLATLAEMTEYYAEQGWFDRIQAMYDFCLAANNFNGLYVEEILQMAPLLDQTGWDDPA